MVSSELKAVVESLVFASEEEITAKQVKDIIDSSGMRISLTEVEEAVNTLNNEYLSAGRAFQIMRIAGGFSYATRKDYSRFVGKLYEEKQRKKLSQSAIETLSIAAYKQPITRNEIEFIRGVNVDYIVNSLLERDLIEIKGRADSPGRPILYGTTKTFLRILGLNSLDDLPKLKEINEILKNQEIEGITEADIELFNSVSGGAAGKEETDHQLTLITNDNSDPEQQGLSEDAAAEQEEESGELSTGVTGQRADEDDFYGEDTDEEEEVAGSEDGDEEEDGDVVDRGNGSDREEGIDRSSSTAEITGAEDSSTADTSDTPGDEGPDGHQEEHSGNAEITSADGEDTENEAEANNGYGDGSSGTLKNEKDDE